jgi:uncharacterized protein
MSRRLLENPPFESVVARRWSRRELLGLALVAPAAARALESLGSMDELRLDSGLESQLLLGMGDPLWPADTGLRANELRNLDWLQNDAARLQQRRFGAGCDALAYFRTSGGGEREQGLLCVNHEFVTLALTFAGFKGVGKFISEHPEAVAWMQAAHGVTVVPIARNGERWAPQLGHRLTRRITAQTPCDIRGPARGAELMRTRADPRGVRALGTFGNCAGGKTPWGTFLTAEENIQDYFGGTDTWERGGADPLARVAHQRWPLQQHSLYGWETVDPRFDLARHPNEPFRHGWIVEIDLHDPRRAPRKRTALGRFCHEAATTARTRDGRIVVYMGDDTKWEYVYKFVTRDRFDPARPDVAADMLDHGTLYVARFDADGQGQWLPLVHDERGPLNSRQGFRSQADVLIRCRAAADLLGATPMDRPEDIEPDPVTGRIYLACTKNADRRRDAPVARQPNAANPRPGNDFGHIIEMTEAMDDGASLSFQWNLFLLAGDPADPASRFLTRYEDVMRSQLGPRDVYYAGYADRFAVAPIACPDNLGFDTQGRMWIATDAGSDIAPRNGCYVVPVSGPQRGLLKRMVTAPAGAEVCGVEFTPDARTLFLSIQHPGEGGTVDSPVSHWPDGGDAPPRSAVVAIRRDDGEAL